MVSRLFGFLILLFAATGAQAQTNPLGAGYSFANGGLFVQISSSLNSLKLPFTISFNVIVPSGTGSFITANPSNSGAGGFAVGYQAANGTFFLNALVQPSSQGGGNACTHNGQMCWRYPPIADGDRHHVCVRWAASPANSYFYLDGIVRDQTTLATSYNTTADLFWAIGASQPAGSTMYDMRVYSGDIGAAGCNNLAVAANQGVYPTTGPLSTGMVLHLPMDSTAGICTNVGAAWTCPDTSGNSNTAVNGSLAPTISIATPAAGTVSGTVNTTVSCTLSSGTCTQVCYYMDGYLLGACPSVTSPTYAFSWDSTKAIDGTHTLTAVGYSVSGLTTTSAPVVVTTSNSVSAHNYFFDGVNGSDANDCKAGTTGGGHGPCKTSTKFNSLTYIGGDTVSFNNATALTSDSGVPPLICGPHSVAIVDVNGHTLFPGCGQNFYASSTPLTVTKYGSGTCNPLTGSSTVVPTGCARIIGNLSGNGLRLYNANNVIVENLALTGNVGAIGIGIDASDAPLGGSDSVTIQNNYVYNFGSTGAGIITNRDKGFQFINNATAGHITNCLIQDNYVTATGVNGSGVGPLSSPDAGIATWAGTTCIVQGNLQENSGGSTGNSQGNGLQTQNWPNASSSTTRNLFQFNVTHNNGGNYTQNVGGPYSIYSIGGDYTTFQFNEEYNQQCWVAPTGFPACNALTNGPDNGGADMDVGSTHITMQYNYIHDNLEVGSNAMLLFSGTRTPYSNPGWGDNWYRYNIAENYWTGMAFSVSQSPTIAGRGFYNNTLSTNTTATNNSGNYPLSFNGTCHAGGLVVNNICANTGTTGYAIWYNQSNGGNCGGPDYNAYYAPTLQATGHAGWIANFGYYSTLAAWQVAAGCNVSKGDLHSVSLTSNPFAGTPNTGGTCWPGGTTPPAGPANPPSAANCPAVYQLKAILGAPLIGTGTTVDSTPTANVTVDYYGNAVPHGTGSGYNIGAYGGTGVP